MATPIAALIIRVLTDTAELVTGVKQVTGQLDGLESRFAGIGNAVNVLKATAAFAAVSVAIRATVDAADEIDRIAGRINDTASAAQRLQAVAGQFDVSIDAVVSGIQNLQANLGNGKIDDPLRKINIEMAAFRAMSPAEQYIVVATALGDVADNAERAAIAKQLLGGASKELANTFRENVGEVRAFYEATDVGVQSLDALKTGIGATASSLVAFGIDLVATMTLMRAYAEIRADLDTTPPPAPTPGGTRPGDLPALPVPEYTANDRAVDELNLQRAIAAEADQEAAYALDQWMRTKGIVTEIVPEFMAIHEANKLITAEVDRWSERIESRGAAAVDDLNRKFRDAVALNLALAGEAASSAAKLNDIVRQQGDPAKSDYDKRFDEIDRQHKAKMAAVDQDPSARASAVEAENAIWEETNAQILALQMGLDGATTKAGQHLEVVTQVGEAYKALQMPTDEVSVEKRFEISKAAGQGRYYGPVDDHGMPDFERLGLGGAGATTNLTVNAQGLWDDPSSADRLARIVDEALTRRSSERSRI